MPNQQQDELPPETEEQRPSEEKATPTADSGYQTPVEADIRQTGAADLPDAKPTAVPESGSSDQLTEGGGNQGTEKR